jgi:hypothetical protein
MPRSVIWRSFVAKCISLRNPWALGEIDDGLQGTLELRCKTVPQDKVKDAVAYAVHFTSPANLAEADTFVGPKSSLVETHGIEYHIVQAQSVEAIVKDAARAIPFLSNDYEDTRRAPLDAC